ncbi:MAG: hypothetical protein KGI58_02675 [Patescibacteria group bacterium]|nr:hypothetical protein [Patescibacteria group bacterium]
MKKNIIILIIFAFILIIVGFLLIGENKNLEENGDTKVIIPKETQSLCYYYSKEINNGQYDKAWLRLNITGENVSGEFNNSPAEKDSKIGTIEGTVGPLNQKIMGRTANLWWNYLSQGLQIKQELIAEFGDGSASVASGEMINQGDGVYIYKDKSQLTYTPTLGQIQCENLDEMITVEKYVRDNIKTIATDKPVLGGSWYVVSIIVNPALHRGEVTYEDGHIQSNATFEYEFNNTTKSVVINKFEVK